MGAQASNEGIDSESQWAEVRSFQNNTLAWKLSVHTIDISSTASHHKLLQGKTSLWTCARPRETPAPVILG